MQVGPEEDVHLLHVRHVDHREQRAEVDARAGLLERFADRAVAGGLADFHEPGRQRPLAVARLDRAPAQQHPLAPHGDGADDRARIDVMDRPALVAARATAVVAFRDADGDRVSAVGAEAHWGSSQGGGAARQSIPASPSESAASRGVVVVLTSAPPTRAEEPIAIGADGRLPPARRACRGQATWADHKACDGSFHAEVTLGGDVYPLKRYLRDHGCGPNRRWRRTWRRRRPKAAQRCATALAARRAQGASRRRASASIDRGPAGYGCICHRFGDACSCRRRGRARPQRSTSIRPRTYWHDTRARQNSGGSKRSAWLGRSRGARWH